MITLVDGDLVDSVSGDVLSPLGCSAFALAREDVPISQTFGYMDERISEGSRYERLIMIVMWGASHQAEDGFCWVWGGSPYPVSAQDRTKLNESLFTRIEEICKNLDEGCYLFIELIDASAFITGLGWSWYTAKDKGWELYLQRMAELAKKYPILIGTGNEPAKNYYDHMRMQTHYGIKYELVNAAKASGMPVFKKEGPQKEKALTSFTKEQMKDQIKDHQFWIANKLHEYGVPVIAAEINAGTGVPEMKDHPYVNVICKKTSRDRGRDVIKKTFQELCYERFDRPDFKTIGQEPPRAYYSGWETDEDKENLRSIAVLHLITGCHYVHHGLSNGQKVQTEKPFWGVDPQYDWNDILYPLYFIIKRFCHPPAGPGRKFVYQFSPDNGPIVNCTPWQFGGVNKDIRIFYNADLGKDIKLKFNKDSIVSVYSIEHAIVEIDKVKLPAGEHVILGAKNKLIFCREIFDDEVSR